MEGQDAYKLKLTMKGAQVRHLWVDAQTFLEVKIEGVPRRMSTHSSTAQALQACRVLVWSAAIFERCRSEWRRLFLNPV